MLNPHLEKCLWLIRLLCLWHFVKSKANLIQSSLHSCNKRLNFSQIVNYGRFSSPVMLDQGLRQIYQDYAVNAEVLMPPNYLITFLSVAHQVCDSAIPNLVFGKSNKLFFLKKISKKKHFKKVFCHINLQVWFGIASTLTMVITKEKSVSQACAILNLEKFTNVRDVVNLCLINPLKSP